MAALTLTDWEDSLKEQYSESERAPLSFKKNVALGTLPKERKGGGGEHFRQTIWRQAPGGGSASFSKAITNQYGSKLSSLDITRVPMYQLVSVGARVMLAGDKVEESVQKVTREYDNGFKELSSKIERRLFRSSTGRIGQVKSTTTVTTDTIILVDKADAWNFQAGDKCQFSADDGGGAVHTGGTSSGILTVESVDRTAGTVKFTGSDNQAEAQVASGDFIFIDGDYDGCLSGFESWLPVDSRSTKLAASFFGLTRNVDSDRLGGIFYDATTENGDANDILVELESRVTEAGGEPDVVYCGTAYFKELSKVWMHARVGFERVMVSASSSTSDGEPIIVNRLYPGIKAMVGSSMLTIMPTRNCPSNRLWMLQRDTWTLRHTGSGIPFFATEELGGEMLQVITTRSGQTEPNVEGWLMADLNLGCEAPGHNGVAKLPVN
jgi:hypothetical protein